MKGVRWRRQSRPTAAQTLRSTLTGNSRARPGWRRTNSAIALSRTNTRAAWGNERYDDLRRIARTTACATIERYARCGRSPQENANGPPMRAVRSRVACDLCSVHEIARPAIRVTLPPTSTRWFVLDQSHVTAMSGRRNPTRDASTSACRWNGKFPALVLFPFSGSLHLWEPVKQTHRPCWVPATCPRTNDVSSAHIFCQRGARRETYNNILLPPIVA